MQQFDMKIPTQESIDLSRKVKLPTILVFDSGMGGLTIYDNIRQQFPLANYIYLFDNEKFPYGELEEDFIIQRLLTLLHQIEQRYSIDLVVIACNTASTVVLPTLRSHFTFPVVGVVPAIKPAVSLTRNGVIGLLATKATVNRPYTHELIKRFASAQQVELLGSSRLVAIAENKLHGIAINSKEIEEILTPWLSSSMVPDTIVLGCTHFPLLRDELLQILPVNTVLVDSGEAIARRVVSLLSERDLGEISTEPHPLKLKNNIAICTILDQYTKQLHPVLQNHAITQLEEY